MLNSTELEISTAVKIVANILKKAQGRKFESEYNSLTIKINMLKNTYFVCFETLLMLYLLAG